LRKDNPISPWATLSARRFACNVARGRSRILHGTWSTLNARGIARQGMERFVISVVRSAVIELDAYVHSANPVDDISEFLSWVRQRRMAPPTSKI